MKKKLLSILLVLSLMLTLVPAAFAADTGTLEGGLTWELDSTGLLTISGEGAIPDNNAGLCRWADMNVTAIEISDGVTAVGAHAFEGCDQAGYVYLPSTVGKLGDGALSGMDTLQAIYVDETNPAFAERDGALYTKDGKTLVQVPAAVTEFVVPDGGGGKYKLSPSSAYKIIGNAVPPLLAYHIGKRVESLWDFYFGKEPLV